jgi:hypothetical protein
MSRLRPLGFNNTYVIALRPDVANRLELRRISDLRRHPELRFGFSNEFMSRQRRLARPAGALPPAPARRARLDHDLAYRGIASGDLDLTDVYATDPRSRCRPRPAGGRSAVLPPLRRGAGLTAGSGGARARGGGGAARWRAASPRRPCGI